MVAMKNKTKYMLTIDREPAIFIGGQICYARIKYRGAGVKESEMVDNPRQARQLAERSRKYRKHNGWDTDSRYGYIPIKLGE